MSFQSSRLIQFICVFIVISVFIPLSGYASINVSSKQTVPDSIEYFYDEAGNLTIEDVLLQNFKEITNPFSAGYRTGAAWFKLEFNNDSEYANFVLYQSEPFWTSFDLYRLIDGEWDIDKNGLDIPLESRSLYSPSPAFKLDIPQHSKLTVYVRGVTVSSHIGEFKLIEEGEFLRPGRLNLLDAYNIYSGVLFFIMILTTLLYSVMREKLYLLYAAYVFSFINWISTQNGSYLLLGIPGWQDALHAIGALTVFFLVLFSQELLRLKENAPFINKLFTYSAIVIFLSGIGISAGLQYVNLFFNVFSSLFFSLLLYTSIMAWLKNYFVTARYYLLSLMFYMPSMALMTMTYNAFLDNHNITRYAFVAGSFIEILFFSFILAHRFIEAKNKQLNVQQELIDEKDQHAKALSDEVEKRTSELLESNKVLVQQAKELEETKNKLAEEASSDGLCKIYNRRHFIDKSPQLIRQHREQGLPISLIMLDIDRFKGINDNFGHLVGDIALCTCADILKQQASEIDITARYGGEEFVMLMPGHSKETAKLVAEKIRTEIEQNPVKAHGEQLVHLTISAGVTELTQDDTGIDDLVRRADKALYKAKEIGRNTVVVSE